MIFKPDRDYLEYIEADKYGMIDIYEEDGVVKSVLNKKRELTEEEHAAVRNHARMLLDYEKPEGMEIRDFVIDGWEEGQKIRLRLFRPANLPENAPILVDIHGGGWVGGCLDIDNSRVIALAQGTPCLAFSVDYRITRNGIHFPQPFNDCATAYRWILEHAPEFGGDSRRIALHGTSAGGNLCAGLALYIRDQHLPAPCLTIINCGAMYADQSEYPSSYQYSDRKNQPFGIEYDVFATYYGTYDGTPLSYYAVPGNCPNVDGLGPHMIVTSEYDFLRDDGLRYALRLFRGGIPCELVVAGRVCHAYTGVAGKRTDWTHEGMCLSLQREFELA